MNEAVKDPGNLVRGNADTGVGHREDHLVLWSINGDPDLALSRELHGIGDQVVEDLSNAGRVTDIGAASSRRDCETEGQPLAVGRPREGCMGPKGQPFKIKRLGLKHELAGLDLREVEDIIEDGQQGFTGLTDDVEVFPLGV